MDTYAQILERLGFTKSDRYRPNPRAAGRYTKNTLVKGKIKRTIAFDDDGSVWSINKYVDLDRHGFTHIMSANRSRPATA